MWVNPARIALFPALALPRVVADIGGLALVAAAGLAILGSALDAITFRVDSSERPTQLGLSFPSPPVSFWDRVAIFARGGGSLTVAQFRLQKFLAQDPGKTQGALPARD